MRDELIRDYIVVGIQDATLSESLQLDADLIGKSYDQSETKLNNKKDNSQSYTELKINKDKKNQSRKKLQRHLRSK